MDAEKEGIELKEEWKIISGYIDYQVSNFGRIKSFRRTNKKHGKILNPSKDGGGYLHIK